MEKWKVRHAKESDLGFIYKTWLNSYACNSAVGRSVRKSVFHREYKKVIDTLLLRSHVTCAQKPDDELVIYGYLVFEGTVLHYCFVKKAFRFSGIAKSLVIQAMGNELGLYTHRTDHLTPIVEKYPFMTYNPFLLYKE